MRLQSISCASNLVASSSPKSFFLLLSRMLVSESTLKIWAEPMESWAAFLGLLIHTWFVRSLMLHSSVPCVPWGTLHELRLPRDAQLQHPPYHSAETPLVGIGSSTRVILGAGSREASPSFALQGLLYDECMLGIFGEVSGWLCYLRTDTLLLWCL